MKEGATIHISYVMGMCILIIKLVHKYLGSFYLNPKADDNVG